MKEAKPDSSTMFELTHCHEDAIQVMNELPTVIVAALWLNTTSAALLI
jgi:hypothetical protein